MKKFLLSMALLVSCASAFAFSGTYVTQGEYRWRADNGGEASASWTAATNTPLSMNGGVGQNMRLRMGYQYTAPNAATGVFSDTVTSVRLQYSLNGNGTWTTITSNGANAFVMGTSALVTGGTTTTVQLTQGGIISGGTIVDAGGPAVFAYHADGSQTSYYEHEWVIRPTGNAQTGTYTFRLEGERPLPVFSPAIPTLNYTAPVQRTLSYDGSPYCDTTATGNVTNTYPSGGTYSSDAGLTIDATTGAVTTGTSLNGLHTVTYTYGGGLTATTQVAIRPQIAMPTGINNEPNQALCAGSATQAVNFSSPITGLTYNWTNSNPSIGLAASGTGNLPSFTSANYGVTIENAQINVKPAGGTGCVFRNMAFRISVNPIPTVDPVFDQNYCRGVAAPATTFVGQVAGSYFTWSSSNPAIGLAQRKGTNTIPVFTTSNATGATSTILVTPIANHCVGTPTSFQIGVLNCTAGVGNTNDGDARMVLDRSIVAGPNPTTGVVRVQYNGAAANFTILVRDQFGNIVLPAQRMTSSSTSVDFGTLWPGSYSIQITNAATGISVSRTIVKL